MYQFRRYFVKAKKQIWNVRSEDISQYG
uniref:Uncharacterized protein n=1 Tax=Brugia malayi TaxID=6279 RepID=A8P989_BRUMA